MTAPPHPFTAQAEILATGDHLYRVHSNGLRAVEFNPGHGAQTRFAFFHPEQDIDRAVVPVLYAGRSPDVAVCETLLHDIPAAGGRLVRADYLDRVMSRLRATRPLRLAKFRGTGLRALGAEASDISDTEADAYPRTLPWAQAAHAAGFDGCVWTSRRCNDGPAYIFFGDRVRETDLEQDPDFGRAFIMPADIGWLRDFCSPLHIRVLA